MDKVTISDDEFGTMWYIPGKKILHHEMHKFMFGEEFHKFLLTGTDAMKRYRLQKWLSDDRKNSVLTKEDINWAMTTWFPQTVKAGWKYWAIVQPEKAIAQMNMLNLAKVYGDMGIIAKFFTEPEPAMKWLESL